MSKQSRDVCESWAASFPHFDMDVLTDQQREVVQMHYEACLSFGAIAHILGTSKSTVQTHHRRALDKLLDAMSYGQAL